MGKEASSGLEVRYFYSRPELIVLQGLLDGDNEGTIANSGKMGLGDVSTIKKFYLIRSDRGQFYTLSREILRAMDLLDTSDIPLEPSEDPTEREMELAILYHRGRETSEIMKGLNIKWMDDLNRLRTSLQKKIGVIPLLGSGKTFI